jgi:hypothetical protein
MVCSLGTANAWRKGHTPAIPQLWPAAQTVQQVISDPDASHLQGIHSKH